MIMNQCIIILIMPQLTDENSWCAQSMIINHCIIILIMPQLTDENSWCAQSMIINQHIIILIMPQLIDENWYSVFHNSNPHNCHQMYQLSSIFISKSWKWILSIFKLFCIHSACKAGYIEMDVMLIEGVMEGYHEWEFSVMAGEIFILEKKIHTCSEAFCMVS